MNHEHRILVNDSRPIDTTYAIVVDEREELLNLAAALIVIIAYPTMTVAEVGRMFMVSPGLTAEIEERVQGITKRRDVK